MHDWNMLYHLIARSLTSTDELKLRFEEITKRAQDQRENREFQGRSYAADMEDLS